MHAFGMYVILALCFNMSMIGGFTVPSTPSKILPSEGVHVSILFLYYQYLIRQVIHVQWGLSAKPGVIFYTTDSSCHREEWNFLFLEGRGAHF